MHKSVGIGVLTFNLYCRNIYIYIYIYIYIVTDHETSLQPSRPGILTSCCRRKLVTLGVLNLPDEFDTQSKGKFYHVYFHRYSLRTTNILVLNLC